MMKGLEHLTNLYMRARRWRLSSFAVIQEALASGYFLVFQADLTYDIHHLCRKTLARNCVLFMFMQAISSPSWERDHVQSLIRRLIDVNLLAT